MIVPPPAPAFLAAAIASSAKRTDKPLYLRSLLNFNAQRTQLTSALRKRAASEIDLNSWPSTITLYSFFDGFP